MSIFEVTKVWRVGPQVDVQTALFRSTRDLKLTAVNRPFEIVDIVYRAGGTLDCVDFDLSFRPHPPMLIAVVFILPYQDGIVLEMVGADRAREEVVRAIHADEAVKAGISHIANLARPAVI